MSLVITYEILIHVFDFKMEFYTNICEMFKIFKIKYKNYCYWRRFFNWVQTSRIYHFHDFYTQIFRQNRADFEA